MASQTTCDCCGEEIAGPSGQHRKFNAIKPNGEPSPAKFAIAPSQGDVCPSCIVRTINHHMKPNGQTTQGQAEVQA